MLEDLDRIDIVTHEPGQWVKFAIIDSGRTRQENPDRYLELLNHKVAQCLAMMEDEAKFEELGRPQDVTIEVRCAYPVRSSEPVPRSVTYNSGRTMNYKLVFLHRPSPYGG